MYSNELPEYVYSNELPEYVYSNELPAYVHSNELPNYVYSNELPAYVKACGLYMSQITVVFVLFNCCDYDGSAFIQRK